MKNTIIIVLSLVVIGLGGTLFYILNSAEASSLDEVELAPFEERVFQTGEILTNVQGGSHIKIKFQIETDSAEAKEGLEKGAPILNNLIIKTLSGTSKDSLVGEEGIQYIERLIANSLNEFLDEGQVLGVYTIDRVMQR